MIATIREPSAKIVEQTFNVVDNRVESCGTVVCDCESDLLVPFWGRADMRCICMAMYRSVGVERQFEEVAYILTTS
jgi:hypothetical protein